MMWAQEAMAAGMVGIDTVAWAAAARVAVTVAGAGLGTPAHGYFVPSATSGATRRPSASTSGP